MAMFITYNFPLPAAGVAPTPTPTGTTSKTLLQVANSARSWRLVEWGISFDGSAAGAPIKCELVIATTGATVTAHVAANIFNCLDGTNNAAISTMALGTTTTGYNATAEGAGTPVRYADAQLVAPTNQYVKTWVPGREFVMPWSHAARIRVTAAASVNAYCYLQWEE